MIETTDLVHDTAAAVDFLRRWHGLDQVVLTAIIPDGTTETMTFPNADDSRMPAWIERHQGVRNLYFHVNPMLRALDSKASKADVARLRALHVDVDPRVGEDHEAERARILKMFREAVPAFSVLVDSGGGFQAHYRLEHESKLEINGDPAKTQELEAYNRQLEKQFGADPCHNSDRLMRIPGTINLPNARKLKKKRKPSVAKLLDFNDLTYKISTFTPAVRPAQLSSVATLGTKPDLTIAGNVPVVGTAELEAWAAANGKTIKPSILAMIATGRDALDPNKHASRSEPLRAVCCELARMEVPAEMIYAVITGPNAIAESVVEKGRDAHAYALRQVERAMEAASGPRWDRVDKEGTPVKTYPNTVAAVAALGVDCSHDLFRARNIVGHHELQEFTGEFSDQAESVLRREIRVQFGFDPGKENVKDAVLELCTQHRFDSLVDHINALPVWDATPRLDQWLITYLGAQDSAYTRGAGSAWLCAAIARALKPGTKFDHMLVLVGTQGVGKTTALSVLGGAFYTDANFLGAKDTREVLEATTGAWIVECGELAGMRHKDTEALKSEITKTEDKGRHAYARNPVTVPRRFVLAGTTNNDRFLHDDTGNRRFWPIEVARIDIAGLTRDRDQLLAEALARYRSGDFQLYLTGDQAVGAEQAQKDRRAADQEFLAALERLAPQLVNQPSHALHGMEVVTNEQVYGLLDIDVERRRGQVGMEVRRAMSVLGWKALPGIMWPIGAEKQAKHRVFVRKANATQDAIETAGALGRQADMHDDEVPF